METPVFLLFLLAISSVAAISSKDLYTTTKETKYSDGTVEKCVCIGFNPNDDDDAPKEKPLSPDALAAAIQKMISQANIQKSQYPENRRIDFEGEGYEDCACSRRSARRQRSLSRILHRQHRSTKQRMDPWLATSYEEDDNSKRHWKSSDVSKPSTKATKTSKTKAEAKTDTKSLDALFDDVSTKKPSKTTKKSRTKSKVTKSRPARHLAAFFSELDQLDQI